jgi:YD repeat-containing protein
MVYDNLGNLLQSTDPLGLTTTNVYDQYSNLLSVTDPLGHTNSYTYDALGNKTSSTYPQATVGVSTTSTTTYNQYSAPTATTDELGNVRTFNYDANYNPQSVTDTMNGALRSDGHDAVGVITKLRFGGKASMPSVSYTFSADGTAFTGRALLPSDVQVPLDEAGPIAIRYLPSDPTINHPADWEWSVLMEMPSIVVLTLFGTCGAIYMTVLWRERKLVSRGKLVAGVVANCVRKNRMYWVEYRFSTEDGTSIDGSGYYSTPQGANSSIWILYLPQNPGRNGPYPFPNYQVEQ